MASINMQASEQDAGVVLQVMWDKDHTKQLDRSSVQQVTRPDLHSLKQNLWGLLRVQVWQMVQEDGEADG